MERAKRQRSNMEIEHSLEVENVSQRVVDTGGPLDILSNVSFVVASGATLAVTGPSGSGKSTLLGLLAGLDVPTAGSIRLLGHELTRLDEEGRAAVRARHIGFVFQSFQLLPHLTALENVMLPLELTQQPARAPAREMLERVGLGSRLRHYPRTLSGGEQQRVSLARAFVQQPQVLFADEPTGNLDERNGELVIELMFAMRREHGTTLILVTHDAGLAALCEDELQLRGGRLSKTE